MSTPTPYTITPERQAEAINAVNKKYGLPLVQKPAESNAVIDALQHPEGVYNLDPYKGVRPEGGDPDYDPNETKPSPLPASTEQSWLDQFLADNPSIAAVFKSMGEHPMPWAVGTVLVSLGMYGAARKWKEFREAKKAEAAGAPAV